MANNSEKDERRALVVDSALSYLTSADLSWSRLLTYDKLEELSGLDRAQIAKDFNNKDQLLEAVLDRALARPDGVELLDEQMATFIDIFFDDSQSMATKLQAAGDINDANQRADPTVVFQMAMWSMVKNNPKYADRLQTMYALFDSGVLDILQSLRDALAESNVQFRDGFNMNHFAVAVVALVEGLHIRSAVDPDAVPDGFTGVLFTLLVEGLVADQTPGSAIGSILDDLGA